MAINVDFSPQNLTLVRPQEREQPSVAPNAPAPKERMLRSGPLQSPLERKRAEARQTAQDFETMFVEMMLKSMRQTAMPEDASNAMDIYTGLLDSEYAKSMSSTGSMGVQAGILEWMQSVDPDLSGPAGSVAETARRANATVESALKDFRMQQYRNQAMLPLMPKLDVSD